MMNDENRVAVEKVYKETIQKEQTLREEARLAAGGATQKYVMNLANGQRNQSLLHMKHSHSRLEIITEKVEKKTPEERNNMEGFDPNSFEVNAMKHTEKIPAHKWDLPCTRAQEIGWLLSQPATFGSIRQRQRQKTYDPHTTDSALATCNRLRLTGQASITQPLQQSAAQPQSPQKQQQQQLQQQQQQSLQHSASAPNFGLGHGLPSDNPRGLGDLNNRRFYRPKTFCPITKYADIYVSLMHEDPFHQSRGK